MKIIKYEDRESWLAGRTGKITGTKLGKLFSKRDKKPLMGYYELIAERLAIAPDEENPMDRGIRLEEEAMERFMKETGKKVDTSLVILTRDDDDSIAVSPDGIIGKKEAVEVKCLSNAKHIEAWLTKDVPTEYREQAMQYFIVNDKLDTLHFVFFNPRMPSKDYFTLEISRESVQADIEEWLELERKALLEINEIVNNLTF